VRNGLREVFGVEMSCQAIQFYDPTKRAGAKRETRWTKLFHATPQGLRNGSPEISARHPTGNAGKLDSIAAEVDRQRHEHSGANGAPFVATINISGLPEFAPQPEAVAGVLEPRD
jgi:hypothetical protein